MKLLFSLKAKFNKGYSIAIEKVSSIPTIRDKNKIIKNFLLSLFSRILSKNLNL